MTGGRAMNPMHIREAVPSDAADLMDLYRNHLTRHPPEEDPARAEWEAMLAGFNADPGYHLLVGEVDGRAVCSVTVVVIRNLTHGLRPYAVIENVVTHADFRKQGLASRLLEAAVSIARDAGCYKVMLMTGSKQESTLQFYRNNGFRTDLKTAFLLPLP